MIYYMCNQVEITKSILYNKENIKERLCEKIMSNALVNVEIVGKVVEDFANAEYVDVRNGSLREISLEVKNDFLEEGKDTLPILVRVRDFRDDITKDSVVAISGTLFTENGATYILAKKIVPILLQERARVLI